MQPKKLTRSERRSNSFNRNFNHLSTISETAYQLAEVSTVHGLRYILSPHVRNFDRFLWAIVVIGATALGIGLSIVRWNHWHDNPVVTTIGTASLSITETKYPAVTICSEGNNLDNLHQLPYLVEEEWNEFVNTYQMTKSFDNMTTEEHEEVFADFAAYIFPGWPRNMTIVRFLEHMTTYHPAFVKSLMMSSHSKEKLPSFDILMNPNRKDEMTMEFEEMNDHIKNLFMDIDFSSQRAQKVLLSMLWFSAMPCHKLLVYCTWKGKAIPCYKLFSLFPTDSGLCCSFNHDLPMIFLKNSYFSIHLREIESKFKLINNMKAIENSEFKNLFDDDLTPQAGKQNGLFVVIDTKYFDNDVATVDKDFFGVTAAVTPTNTFPMMSLNSFLVPPGHQTEVEIHPEKTSTSPDLRTSLDPRARKCYFKDELDLELFRDYTMTNCWMEYLINQSRLDEHGSCHPWNFPRTTSVPCKPIENYLFMEKFKTLNFTRDLTSEVCLPDCETIKYSTSITSAPFRSCDRSNFGLTFFCSVDLRGHGCLMWADMVLMEYKEKLGPNESLPDYVKSLESSMRKVPFQGFTSDTQRTYNAFERDMASILFYINQPVAVELVTSPRLTIAEYLSQVGGILGLFIGFSLISAIEIVYWVTFGYMENVYDRKRVQRRKVNKIFVISNNGRRTRQASTEIYGKNQSTTHETSH